MKRFLAMVVAAASAAVVGCGGLPGMPGGGGGGGGFVMPANSPYMYATDFSDYKDGNWVRYKMEAGGSASETWVKCVGEDGGNRWIQVGMSSGGMEWDHLLLVQTSDRKVVKAFFSGKDDKEWKKCDINEMPAAPAGDKTCPACKKEHKAPEMNTGNASETVDGKSVSCTKVDTTAYDCQGQAMKMTACFSKDVPQLYAMGGKSEHGGLVSMEASGSKTMLVGFGNDAKPKHDLPKE